ncbi:MAG TPA: glucosidase [Cyclobacteriaceae bacterium]
MNIENKRLIECRGSTNWKKWGPYLSERQWGTVREDYTDHANAWDGVTHDQSRSKAYRWGEDGIGGFSDENQRICFAWAFWNGQDPILKERLFGLSGFEGNHGEDVKELYYYLENTPTHAYMKMLYKYPQNEYPYNDLVKINREKERTETEYEIIDTGLFDKDEYFDIYLEYAKNTTEDFVFQAEIINRNKNVAEIYVIPTIWFRNTWAPGRDKFIPELKAEGNHKISLRHHHLGNYNIYFEEAKVEELIFCNNESNLQLLYNIDNTSDYLKDGFHNYVINQLDTINPKKKGTKGAGLYKLKIKGGDKATVRIRFSKEKLSYPFIDFDDILKKRKSECDEFYEDFQKKITTNELKNIQRQAFAGLLWSKQFYYYNIKNWILGDPGRPTPPESRKYGRNKEWMHLYNHDIISMPDKWEYPWYAAWDLAFHCIPFARIDPDFAKEQLLLFLSERYLHPNGQIPAYEWNFSDVNPPVHAWAVLRVFQIDKKRNNGNGDYEFLQRAFHKLLLNFTWWVNRKDEDGNNVFEGGFLGLDNIGVFDRNDPVVEDARLEQADSTGWMAMFALNMLRISLDLAVKYPVYQDTAKKFLDHFLIISGAMNRDGSPGTDLWDPEDNFYYDVMHTSDMPNQLMKIRSLVGLIPLFAVETLRAEVYEELDEFRNYLEQYGKENPKLAAMVHRWEIPAGGERRLFSLLKGYRTKKILQKMLDPEEFLSDYGIRALSKFHKENPYTLQTGDVELKVEYTPGESDSSFFGGNSNWRGPIWFPVNYLILESLLKIKRYYGDEFKIEYPTGSGKHLTIMEIIKSLCERLMNIFRLDEKGNRPVYGESRKMQDDPHFKDLILFYEYFHGDTGRGLGAAHQTGWTALIADIIYKYHEFDQE